MTVPTVGQAEAYLKEAEQRNPGPWGDHSRSAANNARAIAERCKGMDADIAYAMGLLHDIGRREGFSYMAHTIDGYRFLKAAGFEDAAAICLTHSFPVPDIKTYLGKPDVSAADYAFLETCLAERTYTDYDRLIQLCDAISMPEGAVLIEKRLIDVALRHGAPDDLQKKWMPYFEIKAYFDGRAGQNIYKFLPRIVENTFGW